MTTKNLAQRMIALSEETAELLDAKKMLDECFYLVNNVHDKLFGPNRNFENEFSSAFFKMNSVIMELLSEQVDNNSTESAYKVI
jgi:hypothetical protein